VGTPLTLASAAVSPGMARAIRGTPADVVHFHHPNPTAVLSYLASGHPAPLVVTYHSDIVRQRVLGALFRPVLDRFLARAHAIVATSPPYAASSPVLRRHAARVRVLPFGIDPAPFLAPPGEEAAVLRAELGPRVVLGAGRLVYYKGFEYLVRAMRRVRGTLVLVGEGPLAGRLREVAVEEGVAGRVRFAGEVPRLVPFYHAADVLALPSVARSEAFGLVQLEAMAAGVPVVNTRLESGVPFVSPHGETGLTVPPADPEALAAALGALLDDAPLRRRLGAAGRERVRSRFSLERMAAETLALYREAAATLRASAV
jgi:glycosyltransferase involved in cell wall biosynthesis